MKCNYKRALQKKPMDIVEDFEQFVYRKAQEKYYDSKTGKLKKSFFDEFSNFMTDINQSRQASGNEKFITFEMTDEHTAKWYDEAKPDVLMDLKTPTEFLYLYAKLQSFVFYANYLSDPFSL